MTFWFPKIFPTPPARRRPKFAGHYPAWVETLENRVLLSGQSFVAQTFAVPPGTAFDDIPVLFQLTQGPEFTEVGVFQFDADGTVGGVAPGSEGFEDAVLNSATRRVLFTAGSPLGASASGIFLGGRPIGVYFCQDAGISANQFDVQMTSSGARAGFDETPPIWSAVSNVPGSSIRRFDDGVVQATFGRPVQFPLPTINPIAEQTIAEEQMFEISVSAQNPAGPQSDLRYQLDLAPEGVSIDAMTGLINWTPTEAQGPGRYDIVVRVFNANRPESFATERFVVNVTEVNTAPVIAPIEDKEVNQLEELEFTVAVTDADRPILVTDRFAFSLVDNMIAGASIDPLTGEFTWMPTLDDAPGSYMFTVRVVDNTGLEDTETFTVNVNPAA